MKPVDTTAYREFSAWSHSADSIVQQLSVDPGQGLDTNEVLWCQRVYGRNQLEVTRRRHGLAILLAQFKSIVVILLLVAVYLPALANVLRLADPGVPGWAIIVPASLFPVLAAPFVARVS
ncbi:MAG: cation-transporting P-type ATPase [Gammaproteobacteria bacterium]|nr:cation-transporting P-type ATPase [Gammaproteobacteria bacterium]